MSTTHQLSIQIAKRLFLSKEGRVITMHDNTRVEDAAKAGLKPLLIYGLNVEGIGARFMKVCAIDEPINLVDFLSEAWSSEQLEGLPNVLKVGRKYYDAISGLDELTRSLNIELMIAEKNDRSYSINQSVMQNEMVFKNFAYNKPEDIVFNGMTIEFLNGPHLNYTYTGVGRNWMYQNSPKSYAIQKEIEAHIANKKKFFIKPTKSDLTIKFGEWLLTNQSTIAPRKVFEINDVGDEIYEEDFDDELEDSITFDWCSDAEKLILECWPGSIAELAKFIGTTARDISWYMQRKMGLDDTVIQKLHNILRIIPDPDFCFEDGSTAYITEASAFLIASDKTKLVKELYEELSGGGGNIDLSVEIIPENIKEDNDYRFLALVSSGWGMHIIAFPKSGKSVRLLDDNRSLINFSGKTTVSDALYTDVVDNLHEVKRNPLYACITGLKLWEKWRYELMSNENYKYW